MEKVSRPDKTGAYNQHQMPFIIGYMNDQERPAGNNPYSVTDCCKIANQAIEKMIASAREKE